MKKCTRILCALLIIACIFTIVPATASAVNITAQAAVVLDFETGEVLFERDPHTRRPPASMTKIMTAYIVYEEIAAGRLTLDTMIPISHHASHFARDAWPGHLILASGGHYSVETLLRLIMLPSHNGACVALAEYISGSEAAFVERMNAEAERLGMNAIYENSHGLWANSKSAYATAILLRDFITNHPDILRISGMRSFTFKGATVNNTNRILSEPHIDGFKTGTTAAAGPCLASTAYRNGQRVVVVTMNSSNNDNRFNDSLRLLDFGLEEAARRAAEREAEAARRIHVTIDGVPIEFDVQPQLINSRTMVPIRAVVEALGAEVEWDRDTQTVTVYAAGGEHVLRLTIGSYTLYVNDVSTEMDVAPILLGNRTLLPIRFVVEALGYNVDWDNATRTVVITTS
ncbi:MAG: stalk domain-containing protein [Oscillospiraceae bacterium]|nr:stalk domain-containing protein [Oscillospiraceae bacterium]